MARHTRYPSRRLIVLALLACAVPALASCGTGTLLRTPPPPLTAWDRVFAQIRPDGTVSTQTALQAYVLAIGPLPDVQPPAGRREAIFSGTFALDWVLDHWQGLTTAQRQTVLTEDPIWPAATADLARPLADAAPAVPAPSRDARAAQAPCEPDGPGTARVRSVLDAVAPDLAAKLDGPVGICVTVELEAPPPNGELAHTACVDQSGGIDGRVGHCYIFANSGTLPTLSEADLRIVLAHELFHVYQRVWQPTLDAQAQTPAWVKEGEATWVAETLEQGKPAPSHIADTYWNYYLTEPGTALTEFTKSAIGFFAQLQQSGTDVWSILKPTLLAARLSNVQAFHAAADPNGDRILDTWASGYFRKPQYGPDWDIVGPGITGQRAMPQGATIAATPLSVTTAALTNRIFTLTADADALMFAIPAGGRLHDAGHIDTTALDGRSYCVRPTGCTCPKGSAALPLPSLALPLSLAVTGGPTGATGTVSALSLTTYCSSTPSAARVLEAAQAAAGQLKDATIRVQIVAAAKGGSMESSGTDVFTTDPPRDEATSTVDGTPVTTILAGGILYSNVGGGTWTQIPLADIPPTYLEPLHYLQIQNARLIGLETIGGRPSYHLAGTLPSSSSDGVTITALSEDLWLRQDDLFPAKLVYHEQATDGGVATSDVWTGTFTAWNTGITIPVP